MNSIRDKNLHLKIDVHTFNQWLLKREQVEKVFPASATHVHLEAHKILEKLKM